MDKYRAIVIFGPPGSGKGTQAKLFPKRYVHFSTGEMCRNVDTSTNLGKRIRERIDAGNLISDGMIVDLLKQNLKKSIESGGYDPNEQIILLDGIPRNPEQAVMISSFIDIAAVISLEIPDEEIVKRLLKRAKIEGRPDDASEDIIRNRIKIYNQQTHEVLEMYLGSVIKINGLGTVEEVSARIFSSFSKKSSH